MAIAARCLISAKYAANSQTTEYTATGLKAIIDKFTVTNITGGAVTISIHLVPSGQAAGNSNLIIQNLSVAAGATTDISGYLQNQILNAGDLISVVAGAATSLVIRASGREIT